MEEGATWASLLSCEPRVLDAASKLWTSPTLIQQRAIPAALEGKDILARAQTGSGKTAAYIIPILIQILRSPIPWSYKALVLVPTRELCRQVKNQFDALAKYCHINVAHLGDDVSVASQKLALTSNPPMVLIGTPARVSALNINFWDSVAFFVVDEADQQLGMDHGPDIEVIIKKLPATRQGFMMSATLGDQVEKLQSLVLNNPLRLDVAEQSRASMLSHYYLVVSEERRYEVLYTLIQSGTIGKRILLFVNTTSKGYKLRLFLERFGIKSSVLNAQLPVASRIHILQEFNRGAIDVLVAIDEGDDALATEFSASRGVDFQNLAAVVNFDMPQSIEQYVHRVGRTARAMREGAALTFTTGMQEFGCVAEYLSEKEGTVVSPLEFDIKMAEVFRYRVNSVLETITKRQIRESKKIDIRREILNSEKLKAHFEENPADLRMLKHDASLLPTKVDKSLRVLPDYLGVQIKRQQHPLAQKIRQSKVESSKAKQRIAKLDSINEALKRHKKHSHGKGHRH